MVVTAGVVVVAAAVVVAALVVDVAKVVDVDDVDGVGFVVVTAIVVVAADLIAAASDSLSILSTPPRLPPQVVSLLSDTTVPSRHCTYGASHRFTPSWLEQVLLNSVLSEN